MNRVVVTRHAIGLVFTQVCAVKEVSDEEVLEVANRDNPAGTTHGWIRVIRSGEGGPVPCDDHPFDRIHLLIEC